MTNTQSTTTPSADDKITCQICGEETHAIGTHLRKAHEGYHLDLYKTQFPDAPLLSEYAKAELARRKSEGATTTHQMVSSVVAFKPAPTQAVTRSLNDVFGIGRAVAASLARNGSEIQVTVFTGVGKYDDFIPKVDDNYIFPIQLLKNVLLGLELNINIYLWGHSGVGKSTIIEQVCAYTRRPYFRVQHTANTEECHIVGQVLANEKGTYFEPGPLAIAMKYGLVYNADEYDFAHASVTAVYQAILEGKALVIKEAPAEWRVTQPHPDFRFVATGNTNGTGDETGLYNGTNLGNSANYSRFGITDHVTYMSADLEAKVVASQSGIVLADAELLIKLATGIRSAFDSGEVSATIGPRELIFAARLGLAKGSWVEGLKLAYINRLTVIDKEIVLGLSQRIFGQ
jgi:cobaltochelatase CobS